MIRILITDKVKEMAEDYAIRLEATYPAVAELKKLRNHLAGLSGYANHIAYLDDVMAKYPEILKETPDNLKNIVTALTDNEYKVITPRIPETDKNGQPKNVGSAKFYVLVSDAMGYAWVRNHLMPEYVKKLGIKSCVYCNAQYGVTVKKSGRTYTSSYELDHFLPQSRYPHLSTSFFNLQPSCSHCNKTKSGKDALFCLYTDKYSELRPFNFHLTKKSVLDFLLHVEDEKLEIKLDSSDKNLLDSQEKRFHVSKKYESHRDEAAELVILSRIYNASYLKQLSNSVKTRHPQFFDRYLDAVLGFPTDEKKVHRRPLTLLKQDLAKQLGLL